MRYTESLKNYGRRTIFFDLSIISFTALLVVIYRWGGVGQIGHEIRFSLLIFSVPIVWFTSLSWQNAWVFTGHADTSENYRRVIRSSFATLLTVSTISYVLKADFSRSFVLLSIGAGTLLMLIQRKVSWDLFLRKSEREGISEQGLVIAGHDDIGFFHTRESDFPEAKLTLLELSDVNGSLESHLTNTVKKLGIDFVVCEIDWLSSSEMITLFARVADKNDCQFFLVDPLGASAPRRDVQLRGSNMYSRLAEPHLRHSKALFKRFLDIVLGTILLVLSSPFMLIIAVAVKVTSKGSVFYTDRRIGLQGSTFTFPKFRTMYVGADKERKNVLGAADEGIAERYKNDSRITPLGRFLRRFSLDEFPQFWCVITGSMSLVGPRPILAEEIPQMSSIAEHRLIARPGLTGLWQVSGRKETTWDERMQMDLDYVQNWSPAMDVALILKTIGAIVTGRGAY